LTAQSGAVRIFLYNWPIYVATWAAAIAALAVRPLVGPGAGLVLALGAGVGLVWSLVSLGVSYYIYDRSQLASGTWVPAVLGAVTKTWATVHAGLDAEVTLDGVMPGRCVARLDIFDERVMTSPSIRRARIRTGSAQAATACTPQSLPLDDGGCDAVVVAFTAHEIRDRSAREAFFAEVARALGAGGRLLLVEHLRDLANFLVFGPGFLHFVGRKEWLRLANVAKLRVATETRITPFVMALSLERAG
jgi:SAM-dependent methyltransferase